MASPLFRRALLMYISRATARVLKALGAWESSFVVCLSTPPECLGPQHFHTHHPIPAASQPGSQPRNAKAPASSSGVDCHGQWLRAGGFRECSTSNNTSQQGRWCSAVVQRGAQRHSGKRCLRPKMNAASSPLHAATRSRPRGHQAPCKAIITFRAWLATLGGGLAHAAATCLAPEQGQKTAAHCHVAQCQPQLRGARRGAGLSRPASRCA
jgi:hypothetical protein